ncbi:MAG: hypothetical protein LRZ97_00815 [Candidatus Pacebacteria bacterium]|nr:hypothetical protein [Candidatus Paceibacterota bacterium]
MTEKVTNKKAIIGILVSMLVLLVLTMMMEPKLQAVWQEEQLAAVATAIKQEVAKLPSLSPVDIEAKSAVVYEVNTGKLLYAKSADVQLPLASVTKLITTLVARSEIGANSKVIISEKALSTNGESGLIVGDVWIESDLSDFMLTVSSNDAASALALAVTSQRQFVSKMNQFVSNLDLESIVILNESGLDINNNKAGAYGSARDIASLLAYISINSPELLEATTIEKFMSTSTSGQYYKAVNTNKIVNTIPGIIGGKTGYTDLAGGNLAVVFDVGVGHYIVVVVLGSSKEGRFTDVLKLVEQLI